MPYGLPSGAQLRVDICRAEGSDTHRDLVEQAFRIPANEVSAMASAFRRSSVNSIDSFLARRPEYTKIGKALIAAHLCAREKFAELFYTQGTDDHWYQYLWNSLIENAANAEEFAQNQVRFISFNYDRSLEAFLHDSFKNTYGIFDDATAEKGWRHLLISHVYGQLGAFGISNDEEKGIRAYSVDTTAGSLRTAAKGIRVIPEDRHDSEEFLRARDWFGWARYVYILGFGFDGLNCTRLAFPEVLKGKVTLGGKLPYVRASIYQLTKAEERRAQALICGAHSTLETQNDRNTMTLRLFGLPN